MIKFKNIEKRYLIVGASFLAALIVAALVVFFLLSGSSSKKTILELEAMATSIRNVYKNRPNYWGLDNSFVISSGIVKKTVDDKIFGENGKEILVGQGFEGFKAMPGARTFDIVYKNLNKKECISLLTSTLSDNQEMVLISMSVQGIEEKTFDWGGENGLPISANMAKKVCEDGNKNNILWTFE